jgi:toxin CptA
MLVHYYIIKRENIDIDALYQSPSESRVGDVNWAAMISLLVGLVVTWMFLYGLVKPLQGPVARALNGLDLSWLAGMLTAGLLYYGLHRFGVGTRSDDAQTVGGPSASPRRDLSGG